MTNESESTEQKKGNCRSPFLFLGGAILIGLAAALLIFGSGMFKQNDSILQQIPEATGEEKVAQLSPDSNIMLSVGDTAHNFFLQDMAGETVSLEDFQGQPVMINFWATWCAPCRIEMPTLHEVQAAHQEEGLVILAVNDQQTAQDVTRFLNDLKEDQGIELNLAMLLDPEGVVSKLYNVFNFPTTYFVDGDGVITAVHRGLLGESQIEEYLSQTIPQEG